MALLRSILLATVLLSALGAATAQAQSDDDRQRSLRLFEESAEHYNEGRFTVAAELLQEAYELYPEPILLYNLGRALEGAGDPQAALEAYERYLQEDPQSDKRGAVQARIETLRDQVEERNALEEEARRAREGSVSTTDTRTKVNPVPWVVAGVGVVGLGVGAVFGLMATSAHADAVDDPVMLSAAQSAEDADTYAMIANVSFIAGGILAAIGVTWGVLTLGGGGGDAEDDAGDEVARLSIGPGSLALSGSF